jgi:hypothetical protein
MAFSPANLVIVTDRTEQDVLLKPPIALTAVNSRVSGSNNFKPGELDSIVAGFNANESLTRWH